MIFKKISAGIAAGAAALISLALTAFAPFASAAIAGVAVSVKRK